MQLHGVNRLILILISASHVLGALLQGGQAQPIVLDTDIMSDVDDVGALTVANVLHNCGLADLHGVAINTQSEYGALAASVRTNLHEVNAQ